MSFFGKNPVHPALIMLMFWMFIFIIYYFGPIELSPSPTLETYVFLIAHILFFILGSVVLKKINVLPSVDKSRYWAYIPQKQINWLILSFLSIGIIGGSASITSKLSVLDTLDLSSIAQLRTLRAQALLSAGTMQSGLLSGISFLLYPAGFVALVLSLFLYEEVPLYIKLMVGIFVLIIGLLAICAGGRSPILVLFLILGASCYARKKMGKSLLPKSVFIRVGIVSLLGLFFVYSSIIWVVRAQEAGNSIQASLEHAENSWGAKPKDYLIAASDYLDDPGLTYSILSTTFYFIQSLSISERVLESKDSIPILYGAYQIDLFAALLRAIPGGSDFLKYSYDQLLEANVYGFFTGAWTGLFIDFGPFSFLIVLIWGVCAGKSWMHFRDNPNIYTGIMYVFWLYSIFISFVSSPFGFSNSFMIFFWFLCFYTLTHLIKSYVPKPPKELLTYLPTSNFQLPTSNFQLPTSNFQLPTSSGQVLERWGGVVTSSYK